MVGVERGRGRRTTAALGAVILHLAAVWLSLNAVRQAPQVPEAEFTSVWLLLDPESPEAPIETARPPAAAAAPRERRPVSSPASKPVTAPPAVAAPSIPNVDWRQAAAQAVRRAGAGLLERKPRGFGAVPSPQYRKCRPKKESFEWDPDALKSGLDAILPSFRVGKRCFIVPPFFSCALGELPPPNSHMLDDMKDPDRDRNSVPGSDLCGEDKVSTPPEAAAP
jgi:hypothetical protein